MIYFSLEIPGAPLGQSSPRLYENSPKTQEFLFERIYFCCSAVCFSCPDCAQQIWNVAFEMFSDDVVMCWWIKAWETRLWSEMKCRARDCGGSDTRFHSPMIYESKAECVFVCDIRAHITAVQTNPHSNNRWNRNSQRDIWSLGWRNLWKDDSQTRLENIRLKLMCAIRTLVLFVL